MYCPDLFVIMRLRQTPIQHTFTVVVLKPLDEADLRVYVLEHEAGGVRYGSAEAISAIFRHTDGVPVRIDATLRDLEIITFDQLAAVNRDLTGQELGSVDVAPALASAVAELAQAADPQKKRSFDLLKALSAFPYGEALERIKRFNGPHPLFPSHALILIQKSLVTNNSPIYAPVAGISSDIRILSVPREVRDYVRSLIKADELRDVTRKAAGLYFGSEWKTGEIKSSAVSRFKRVNASSSEIGNAMAVVLRLINEAVDQEDSSAIASALKIADSFASVLLSGDHYRSVVVLCRDVLTAVPDLDSETIEYIEFNLAKALRMIGENQTALDILSGLDVSTFSNSEKQSVLLNQSLAHQKLGNSLEAIDSASSLLRLDTKSNSALQAKAILLEERRADGDTLIPEQLRKLEIICRKRGAHVVANNLALDRVGRQRVGSRDSTNALDEVLKSAQDGKDFYNAARSIIKIAEISVAEKTMLSAKNKLTLISAYEFLLNERISSLFDRCHAVLWNVFEHSHDIENLFRLFRHSSFIWRLREDASREIGYLRKLTVHAETLIRQDIKSLNKEITYYLVRAGSALSQSAGNQIGGLDEASS